MVESPRKPRKRGLLDYRDVVLRDLKPAGGTSGARVTLGVGGEQWLVKSYGGDPDRVATELLANAIYRELGILVPEAGIGQWEGSSIAVVYPMLEGQTRRWKEPSAALAEGFVADALLANWDVVGLTQDNVLWQGDVPVRLDQGGTFEFRAMGERKQYGPEPVELETMLGPLGQARTAMLVTEELIERKSREAHCLLNPARISDLVAEAPFRDEDMRVRLEHNLLARLERLRSLPRRQRSG